jgi:hypothetical protein
LNAVALWKNDSVLLQSCISRWSVIAACNNKDKLQILGQCFREMRTMGDQRVRLPEAAKKPFRYPGTPRYGAFK